MANPICGLALIASLAGTEIAWWEGRWADQGVSCNASTGDRPMILSWNRLDLGEAECVSIREAPVDRKRLRLNASCREHGYPTARPRSFVLEPSNGGRTMEMTDGDAIWRLRKC